MSFFSRFFGNKGRNGDHDPASMPWDQKPSILEFIHAHLDEGKPGLSDEVDLLPDEDRINQGSPIRWAAGAMDGVLTHHMGPSENDHAVRKMVQLVVAYSRQPTAKNKFAVYQHIIDEHIVSIIDPVIEALINEQGINHERLHELAHSFATESPDREPVKFGIATLGLFRQSEKEELFQTLGRHEEFTLFCVVALANTSDDSQESLWKLAQNVTGWGRIHTVERLAQCATQQEIKDWLLRDGFRNAIMSEYLAGTCARAGGLLEALSRDEVDRSLLTSAGEIIQSLMIGGPADDIDDYEDAPFVLEYFLAHMDSSAETVEDFVYIHSIHDFLTEEDARWERRYESGWTSERREKLRLSCDRILERPEWRERVHLGLNASDEVAFSLANQAAGFLEIDTWEIHWRRLKEKPLDSGRWYHVMMLCNESRIADVVEFAESHLDLAALSTGAAEEMGLGRGYEQHRCLDIILQELRRFPKQGERLIESGLKNPVIRNRNMAVAALASWPRIEWPSHLEQALQQAIQCEPHTGVMDWMRKAMNGESLDA